MMLVTIFFAGLFTGAFASLAIVYVIAEHRRTRRLPPATARQLARAARANRLELRKPSPRWIPLSDGDFNSDSEDTR